MAYRNDTFRMMAREAAREQAQRAPSYVEHNAQQADRARRVANVRRACRAAWNEAGKVARSLGCNPYNSPKGCAV